MATEVATWIGLGHTGELSFNSWADVETRSVSAKVTLCLDEACMNVVIVGLVN